MISWQTSIALAAPLISNVIAQTPDDFNPGTLVNMGVAYPAINIQPIGSQLQSLDQAGQEPVITVPTANLLDRNGQMDPNQRFFIMMIDTDVVRNNVRTTVLHWFQPDLIIGGQGPAVSFNIPFKGAPAPQPPPAAGPQPPPALPPQMVPAAQMMQPQAPPPQAVPPQGAAAPQAPPAQVPQAPPAQAPPAPAALPPQAPPAPAAIPAEQPQPAAAVPAGQAPPPAAQPAPAQPAAPAPAADGQPAAAPPAAPAAEAEKGGKISGTLASFGLKSRQAKTFTIPQGMTMLMKGDGSKAITDVSLPATPVGQTAYLPPGPPPGPPHRYVQVLFAQPQNFSVPQCFQNVLTDPNNPTANNQNRLGFDINQFLDATGVQTRPVAANYFRAQNPQPGDLTQNVVAMQLVNAQCPGVQVAGTPVPKKMKRRWTA